MLDVERALSDGLEAASADLHPWEENVLHVSDTGYGIEGELCPRQLWLRLREYRKKEDGFGVKLMFDHGHQIHDRLAGLLRLGALNQGWKVVGVEEKIEFEGLTGRIDAILHDPDGRVVVFDWKTKRGNAFRYLTEPKVTNVLQVQTYMRAIDASYGILAYVDREGQNGCLQFPVKRDDAAVSKAIHKIKEIQRREAPPPLMQPDVTERENKGPNSIKVGLPWQCRWCSHLDVSCPGAVPLEIREDGIVARRTDAGVVAEAPEYEPLIPLINDAAQQ